MKSTFPRIIAFLLVAALAFTMLPAIAFAAADSELSRLTLSGVSLDRSFSATVLDYEANVLNSTRSTRVTATAKDRNATITINGSPVASGEYLTVDLAEGNNTITIEVVGAVDTPTTTRYTVIVDRLEAGQSRVDIRTGSLPDGVVGRSYNAQVSVSGSGTKYYYLDGNLPEGLSFNENNGRFSGTPKAGDEGEYSFSVRVESDSNSTTDEEDYSITIYERGYNLEDDDDEEPASRPAASTPVASRPAAPAASRPAATAQTSGVSQSSLISQVQSRINSAAAGAAVNTRYRNLGTVELETLQTIARAAGSRTISLGSERQDEDGNVESRVTIDPKKSTKDISLLSSTTISSENCKNVTALMNRFYSNQVSVIRLDQKGSYGQTVTVYAKLDNARLNTTALRFYSYDSAANKLDAITTGYRVSDDGYVTFNTTVGNYVIVTDSAMRQK
jgi:hypothetical protein